MNHPFSIPKELNQILGDEPVDFILKAKWNHSRTKFKSLLFISIIWNAFVFIFLYVMYVPLFKKGEVHFIVNDIPTVATWDNLQALLIPSLILGVFLIVGIFMIIWSFITYFQEGGYFAGTPSRFIKYRKGKAEIYDWEQFTGNMRIKTNRNSGSLEFLLRTGKIQSNDNGKGFVPDRIEIAGISNVLEIEKKCRKRIKENDPTPAQITS